MEGDKFHQHLQNRMDEYIDMVYSLTRSFPREELYGVTSQLRRAALSVVLNYIEGYARGRTKVLRNFLETSYGSLKESKYLLNFSCRQGYISEKQRVNAVKLAEEIGAMLWGTIRNLKEE